MPDSRTVIRWLLFDGDRSVVAALVVVGTFLSLIGLGTLGVVDTGDTAAVRGVGTAFVPGLIAFLSIVLGINQLVLHQELGSAGEIRKRIRSVREYRHDVEDVAGTRPSPALPVGFLSLVVGTLRAEGVALGESLGPDADTAVADPVRHYAREVVREATMARESLERLRPGRINALLPVLEYDNSHQLYEARRLLNDHDDALPDETRESLSCLIETLELFDVARFQFRTTYTQRVLAHLSRRLLYVGVPALVVVVVLGLTAAGSPLLGPGPVGLVAVSALFSVALSPLALLSSYLLRIAAVSERTISPGPFVSRPDQTRGERRETAEGRPATAAVDETPGDDDG